MKLIIKQYLTSLKERGELDAILPDLLSQMGLNVFSQPSRGTRQYGVDIAAVGEFEDKPETVYLFSIKQGDLGRKDWNSGGEQDLQPSLDEILTVYIPTHLPAEHRGKPISICICIGGYIKEEVRLNVTTYEEIKKTDLVKFEEWNGDILASMIEKYFLQEDLLPTNIRPLLRKSLALLDEPEASFGHFSQLLKDLSDISPNGDAQHIRTVRQINICLWILYAWARDADNLESAYLSAELALLYSWELVKGLFDKTTKSAVLIKQVFASTLFLYRKICENYVIKIIPHVGKVHGLSCAVGSSCKQDVNLKLFDVLGRLSLAGIWEYWNMLNRDKPEGERDKTVNFLASVIKSFVSNNPMLLSPLKDKQTIDISLALLFLYLTDGNQKYVEEWLNEIFERSIFAYETHGDYPCIIDNYRELLEHPKSGDDEYRKEVTAGSILYPTIALWAAILEDQDLFNKVKAAKEEHLIHCNFQLWYPDDKTEDRFYFNNNSHGTVLSDISLNQLEVFLETVFGECKETNYFESLSAISFNLWPLVLVGCRHYRIPVPVHFLLP